MAKSKFNWNKWLIMHGICFLPVHYFLAVDSLTYFVGSSFLLYIQCAFANSRADTSPVWLKEYTAKVCDMVADPLDNSSLVEDYRRTQASNGQYFHSGASAKIETCLDNLEQVSQRIGVLRNAVCTGNYNYGGVSAEMAAAGLCGAQQTGFSGLHNSLACDHALYSVAGIPRPAGPIDEFGKYMSASPTPMRVVTNPRGHKFKNGKCIRCGNSKRAVKAFDFKCYRLEG